jgi:hypothetical protein
LETLAFLKRVLPSSGIYFVDVPYPTGHGFKHHTCESVDRVAQLAVQYDMQGATVYHACASFQQEYIEKADPIKGGTKRVQRVQDNVKYVRSFWLDLDVDPTNDRKFASQADAITKLKAFCDATGLPIPLLVSSGYGVHCYWTLDRDVLPGEWKEVATAFKALTAALDFGQGDTTRTADMASVLRPPGTHNRKVRNGQPTAVPVTVLHEGETIAFAAFEKLVLAGCTKFKAQVPKAKAPKVDPNAAFALANTFPDSHADEVAAKCQQIRLFRDEPNSLDEPTWYAGVQLLYHTVESEEIVHKWSSGHNSYSAEETQRKIIQITAFGPTTCATFDQRNPAACKGCKFAGKIVSPIQLGAVVEILPAPVAPLLPGSGPAQKLPDVPEPFKRTNGGLFVDVEGALIKFYEYDLYPIDLNDDPQVGYETATIRHYLPHEGWLQFTLPTYLLEDKKQFLMHLRKNFVKPTDGNKMVAYVDSYLRQIQAQVAMRKSFNSMGWKQGFDQFILGKRAYKSDGLAIDAGLSMKLAGALEGFVSKGELDTWVDMTAGLNRPDAVAHAFCLLLGFGAPLLKFTGYGGVTFNMMGRSGVGKSLMGNFALSIYGDPKPLALELDSTKNSRLVRMCAYNNLPVYIDETTNIAADAVSELMYRQTSGKGREGLYRDGGLKGSGEWSTFLITSANASYADKLQHVKADSEAEMMRLFEFELTKLGQDFAEYMRRVGATLQNHYGVAGPKYIQGLVKHAADMKELVEKYTAEINTEISSDGRDRFLVAGVACALAGGELAQLLGLIKFDLRPIREWACHQLRMSTWQATETRLDAVSFLGEFLDDTAGTRLVLSSCNIGVGLDSGAAIKMPGFGSSLTSRFELDTRQAYVSRKAIHDYANKRKVMFLQLRKELTNRNVLVNHDARKVLGAGTNLSGAQVPCWLFDLKHPVFADLLKTLEAPKQEAT